MAQGSQKSGFKTLDVEKTLEDKVEENNSLLADLKVEISKLSESVSKEISAQSKFRSDTENSLKLLTERVLKLETDAAENVTILNQQKNKISELEDKVDFLEQRDRSYCLRFYNVPIDKKEEEKYGHSIATCKAAFRSIQPILEGMSSSFDRPINNHHDIFKNGHQLATPKNETDIPPLILRLKTRDMKSYILANKYKLKQMELPTQQEGSQRRSSTRASQQKEDKAVNITQVLTKRRFDLLQEYIKSNLFSKVWFIDGTIVKFIKKNDKNSTVYTSKINFQNANDLLNSKK